MQWKHPVIVVIMEDVKIPSMIGNLLEQLELIGACILDGWFAKSQGLRSGCYQATRNSGVTARKYRGFDVCGMEAAGEFVDDSLSSAIEPRRYTFERGCNQSDTEVHAPSGLQ